MATFSPKANTVVFIAGPEHPTDDWQYAAWHRQGIVVDLNQPKHARPLDARDITLPYALGALRGGTHVHVFDGNGELISFTYEDHVLASLDAGDKKRSHDFNQRNIGVSVRCKPVCVARDHARNHDGSAFSVLVTRTTNVPRPGSDEISRACEDSWVGTHGYVRPDGSRRRGIAFQGSAVTRNGTTISEVYIADIPDDVTKAGSAPLEGTSTTRPSPPLGTQQRRLIHTAELKFPGLQGPRHWLRSSPDGARIAFLMRDDNGTVQIWTISPNGGTPQQLTHNPFNVASVFSWSSDGQWIAYVADNSIFISDTTTGTTSRLTPRTRDSTSPRPEACVFSPDGNLIAYVRPVLHGNMTWNQVFVIAR